MEAYFYQYPKMTLHQAELESALAQMEEDPYKDARTSATKLKKLIKEGIDRNIDAITQELGKLSVMDCHYITRVTRRYFPFNPLNHFTWDGKNAMLQMKLIRSALTNWAETVSI